MYYLLFRFAKFRKVLLSKPDMVFCVTSLSQHTCNLVIIGIILRRLIFVFISLAYVQNIAVRNNAYFCPQLLGLNLTKK